MDCREVVDDFPFGELDRRFAAAFGDCDLAGRRFVAALPGVDGVRPVGQAGQRRFAAAIGRRFRARAVGGHVENLGSGDRSFVFVGHLDVNVACGRGEDVHRHRVAVFFAAAFDGQRRFVGPRFGVGVDDGFPFGFFAVAKAPFVAGDLAGRGAGAAAEGHGFARDSAEVFAGVGVQRQAGHGIRRSRFGRFAGAAGVAGRLADDEGVADIAAENHVGRAGRAGNRFAAFSRGVAAQPLVAVAAGRVRPRAVGDQQRLALLRGAGDGGGRGVRGRRGRHHRSGIRAGRFAAAAGVAGRLPQAQRVADIACSQGVFVRSFPEIGSQLAPDLSQRSHWYS